MKKMKHFGKWLGIGILVILVAIVALNYWHPGTRTVKTTQPVTTNRRSTVRLVALGDSLTEGVGDQQKKGGYTGRIATKIRQTDHVKVVLHNYGLAGDRSDQIEKRLVASEKMQHQVTKAQAITLTVGGNDLLQTLTKNVTINQQSQLNQQLTQAQKAYAKKLTSLLGTIRRYNPQAPIYLFTIYNPIYVYFANLTQITNAVDNWNTTTQRTVRSQRHLYVVDINRDLSVGQFRSVTQQARLKRAAQKSNDGELSVASFQKQILASDNSTELNHYLSPADHFHPNAKGYRLMTQKLFAKMQTHQQWLRK
ncbi:ethanolamine utilization protein EutQ [Levilactobacillus zymae]|uniref:Ethanolamine utilization protein EutQ n=2 Tax=Levilactobacillus zymae TaxID=267363 RepID=A0ABQ0WST4_9LACO|nr:lysophospholipase L1 related esterase [Levilactobacillus zymae DSM 19395]GEO70945.1 ethanolamine utilization protein EutQ [Levilactobacillus zymae]